MLISQTFRGSPELEKEGYILLQKWYTLTNKQKHRIIKTVLADGLRDPKKSGAAIKNELAAAIHRAVPKLPLKY